MSSHINTKKEGNTEWWIDLKKKLPVFPVMRGNVFESKSAYKKLLNIAYDYQQVYIKECTTWEESRVTMENFTQKLIVHF